MNGIAPLVERLEPVPDPAESAAALLDLPYPIFLDSATGLAAGEPHHLGRYSFVSADPVLVVRSKGLHTDVLEAGQWRRAEADALEVVRGVLRDWAAPVVPGLPPFQGGAAGYIGYDYGAVLERVPPTRFDDLAVPDVVLGLYDWVLAWDHARREAWLISTGLGPAGAPSETRAQTRAAEVRKRLSRSGRAVPAPPAADPRAAGAPSYPVTALEAAPEGLRSTFTHRGYLDAVARVREYIVAGDIFQANLSQRLQAPLREAPFDLYRRLRRRNPAPFAAYFDCGDLTVMSASPERFLRLDEHGSVETRPIKGTRPRGLGPMHDAALGRALAESEKDRAENVMIVDLLRNDLSRVCRPGSVRVPELFALEHHPTVHHLVSTVVGELTPNADAVDLVRATFPAAPLPARRKSAPWRSSPSWSPPVGGSTAARWAT